MEQPDATLERKHGTGIMRAQMFIKLDERGHIDKSKSYAILTLHDSGKTRSDLVWSRKVTPPEAREALSLFEQTGVTIYD